MLTHLKELEQKGVINKIAIDVIKNNQYSPCIETNQATLLNAGRTTNFIYKVEGEAFTQEQIEEINLIDGRSKIKDRINKIINEGAILKFSKLESVIFSNNLILIDSSLPNILAEILYVYFTSTYSKTSDLVDELNKTNPLSYDLQTRHPFYSYKIKRFLTDIALGMMPGSVWTGELDATGGYLVVKDDGEILCYHIYNRNEFENYLLNNTKLETASSSRHGFGNLYQIDDSIYFNLNLQIRFIK